MRSRFFVFSAHCCNLIQWTLDWMHAWRSKWMNGEERVLREWLSYQNDPSSEPRPRDTKVTEAWTPPFWLTEQSGGHGRWAVNSHDEVWRPWLQASCLMLWVNHASTWKVSVCMGICDSRSTVCNTNHSIPPLFKWFLWWLVCFICHSKCPTLPQCPASRAGHALAPASSVSPPSVLQWVNKPSHWTPLDCHCPLNQHTSERHWMNEKRVNSLG